MGNLRLRDWRREALNAGIIVLTAVILGSLLGFWLLYKYSEDQLLLGGESCTVTTADDFYRVLEEDDVVAVMFSSDTCPVCKQMEPHWRRLCRTSASYTYVIVKLNEDTYPLYMKYGVLETPTFIVFRDGAPIARHTGGFPPVEGTIADTMRAWVEANAGGTVEESLDLLRSSCKSCHPIPSSGEAAALRDWLAENRGDQLVDAVARAYASNMTLSQLYGGTSQLVQLIISMNTTLTPSQAESIAVALDRMIIELNTRGNATPLTGVPQEEESQATGEKGVAALGVTAGLVAGLVAAFSPCVFPLLLSYTALLQTREDRRVGALDAVKSALAAATGVFAVGILFVLLGDVVQAVSKVLLPAAAATLMAAGILGYMDVPTFINISVRGKRGLVGFSFIYGLLAVQCSFPLVAGTMLLLASGGWEAGLPALVAFTAGIAFPVGLAVVASSKASLASILSRLSSKKGLRYANLVLAVSGLVLLAYTVGVI